MIQKMAEDSLNDTEEYTNKKETIAFSLPLINDEVDYDTNKEVNDMSNEVNQYEKLSYKKHNGEHCFVKRSDTEEWR